MKKFICNRCNQERHALTRCPRCQSYEFRIQESPNGEEESGDQKGGQKTG